MYGWMDGWMYVSCLTLARQLSFRSIPFRSLTQLLIIHLFIHFIHKLDAQNKTRTRTKEKRAVIRASQVGI